MLPWFYLCGRGFTFVGVVLPMYASFNLCGHGISVVVVSFLQHDFYVCRRGFSLVCLVLSL